MSPAPVMSQTCRGRAGTNRASPDWPAQAIPSRSNVTIAESTPNFSSRRAASRPSWGVLMAIPVAVAASKRFGVMQAQPAYRR